MRNGFTIDEFVTLNDIVEEKGFFADRKVIGWGVMDILTNGFGYEPTFDEVEERTTNFAHHNKAIDIAIEKFNLSEEDGIELIGDFIDVLRPTPTDLEECEEILKTEFNIVIQ